MNISFYLHDEKSPIALEKQLDWLGKRYRFISWEEVYDFYYHRKSLNNTCHLTIDDGWLSTYTVIYPLLKRKGIPASIFVSPHVAKTGMNFWYHKIKGCDEIAFKKLLIDERYFKEGIIDYPLDLVLKELLIDDVYKVINQYYEVNKIPHKSRGFMNVDELREIQDSGLIEIGAHTMMHPILANETTEHSTWEIKESIASLSELLGKKINIFAYPNGLSGTDWSQREMDIVKDCEIKLAFSVNPGIYNWNDNPFNIPRVGSINRLKLGRLGLVLPSLHDQIKPRTNIRNLLQINIER